MKIILAMFLLLVTSSLWAQSTPASGVTLNIRLHSILAVDDLTTECAQKGKVAVINLSLKTLTTDFSDVHLMIPYQFGLEEYYLNKVRLLPGESHLLFRIKPGVSEHSARITVRGAGFNFCESMGELLLTTTPR